MNLSYCSEKNVLNLIVSYGKRRKMVRATESLFG